MRRILPLIAGVAIAFAVFAPARATTGTLVITTDTTLTEDHDAGSADVGIILAADDITLDCAGYGVSGTGSVGVYVDGHDGTTVENCTVTGFTAGIQVFGSSNTLRASTVSGAVGSGVFVAGDGNLIAANRSTGNGDSGFRLGWSSSGNTFLENRATANTGTGFVMDHSPDTRVVGNLARGNQNGFVWMHTAGGFMRGNVARGNTDQGFTIQRVRALRAVGNLARRNGGAGFLFFKETKRSTFLRNAATVNALDGFALFDVSDNDVNRNRAGRNGDHGFNLGGTSDGNRLTRNRACGDGQLDALDAASGMGNVWANNHFCSSDV